MAEFSNAPGEASSGRRTAGVIAPPPILVGVVLLAAELLHRWRPLSFAAGSSTRRWVVVSALAIGALALIGSAILTMRRARTPVEPWKPTKAIVTSGAFALSRNPIYAGLLGLQLAAAWGLSNMWTLLLLPVSVALLHWGVIAREESYLSTRFGEEYDAYRRRVRRWL